MLTVAIILLAASIPVGEIHEDGHDFTKSNSVLRLLGIVALIAYVN